jgi:RiboL-PSP-HEPN
MSIRTIEQLYDALAADLIWRKKELSAYKLAMETAENRPDRRQAFLRGAVALLYAHWEGFVKQASQAYLEYVFYQRLKHSELAPPFLALAIRPLLRAAGDSGRIATHLRLTRFFLDGLDAPSVIPVKDGISTRANLSSRVLREIVDSLGLDYRDFETKAELIDEGLLESRNTIAHGEFLLVTPERFSQLHSEVIAMMETFSTQVTNAAALRRFAA